MPITVSENLGIIILSATGFIIIGNFLRIPSLVVYLFTGLFLGPWTNIITPFSLLEVISQSGITLLLFLVGLEINLSKIRDIGKEALVAGIGQVIFTAFFGFFLAWFLGYTPVESIYLAIALTFSSTVVVVKLLDEKGHLNRLYGRLSVGIFLVQDIIAILILTFLSALQGSEKLAISSLLWAILRSFLALSFLVLLMTIIAKYLLPVPFHWASRSMDTLVIWSLALCFGVSLLAEKLHLSMEIGSFLAGLALAQNHWASDLRRRVHPLMNFFIMLFFVLLGIRMDFSEAFRQIENAIILALFVLIGNPIIFYVILRKMHHSQETSFLTGVTVAQISEFSFIVIHAGILTGMIGNSLLSIVSLIGIITISLSAYLILYGEQLFQFWKKIWKSSSERFSHSVEKIPIEESHFLVIGMNELGRKITEEICKIKKNVVAVDMNPHHLHGLPCKTIVANIEDPNSLDEIKFRQAKLVISALSSEETNNFLAFLAKKYNIPFAAHARDPSMKDGLIFGGSAFIISPKEAVVEEFQKLIKRL